MYSFRRIFQNLFKIVQTASLSDFAVQHPPPIDMYTIKQQLYKKE